MATERVLEQAVAAGVSAAQGLDTAVVRSPLPGGVATVVRFLFNLPTWFQIWGFVAGALVACVLLVLIWWHWAAIVHWLATRSHGWKLALVTIVLLVVAGGSAVGMVSWNYMMHNNDFCVGCHVMTPAFTKFQHSEHRKLECHNCHEQSLYASTRQLVLWVAEKPQSIPPHAKVPSAICKSCHNTGGDSLWKRIMNTAGHSVHLRSDSSALKNVQCVTCHGAEIHHFVPLDKTCGQSGCHENIRIQLGKMAAQTDLHCTGCHAFTAEVAANISPDSARKSLVPVQQQCLGCHAMQAKLASFDFSKDKHHGVCGACHDPHKQATPKAAFGSCTNAGCHTRPDTLTAFHRGLHAGDLANCGTCHKAHTWKAPTVCLDCHQGILKDTVGRPARRSASTPTPERAAWRPASVSSERPDGPMDPGDAFDATSSASATALPQQVAATPKDTTRFTHARHKNLSCTSCHSSGESHGQVTISQPTGCQDCHHSSAQRVACATCHPAGSRPGGAVSFEAKTTVWTSPQTRVLNFDHAKHQRLECRTCHTATRTLAVERSCASCHADHHVATADCKACHQESATVLAAHPRIETHQGCGGTGCHQDQAVLTLTSSRNVCLACHQQQANHMPGGDCAGCHRVRWTVASAGGKGS